ncbi:SAR endolysin glycoside hydrolase [Burkholderia phage Mica]|uniref:Lysozyme n=1 Tax=Burkholderia phage Mica TaxID=2767579 RepID=A0A873WBN5_9CAUD|nr:SAR endolysin glycoside hydrolase [Burkholderia phage Mica]QPB08679.1 SAR endolysin glycoside hydrolase [Burkholderia phage Mica]
MPTPRKRIIIAALTVSATAFTAWQAREGYTDHAVIPTKGDVPTIGHGSTHYENGAPVKMGDTITRKRANELARNLMSQDEAAFRASLPADTRLAQSEYDEYVDFIGQFGIGNWRKSTMRRELIAGNYAAACHGLLNYRYSAGYDCSTLVNGKPNKRCYGVWVRQQQRYANCMGAK